MTANVKAKHDSLT